MLSVGLRAKGQSYDLSVEKYHPSLDFITFSNLEANNSNNTIKVKQDLDNDYFDMGKESLRGTSYVDQWVNTKHRKIS